MPSIPWNFVYLNRILTETENAKISVLDRGFLFGDGVYEVLRIYDGKPFLLDAHLSRLKRSLNELRIPYEEIAGLTNRVQDLVKRSQYSNALVYVEITRGAYGYRTHFFPENTEPTEVILISEFDDPNVKRRKVGGRIVTLSDQRWKRVDIKSINLLPNVLAAQVANEKGLVETVFYLVDGSITEGAHSNIFAVLNGKLRTAPLGKTILPGVTRDYVIQLAKNLKVSFEERSFTREELYQADEVFMTSTTFEILPVTEIDDRPVGNGRPGAITTQLQNAFKVE